MSKVFIETVGCPKNQEDSERMAGLLTAAGHTIVFYPDEANVIIVNTCGFIEAAKRESIETIFNYLPYKEAGARLVVTGCMTQRYPEELTAELPEADALFGVNDYEKLPGVISALSSDAGEAGLQAEMAGRARFCCPRTNVSGDTAAIIAAPREALSPRHSSYLKIAEGCSNNCAYCVIPQIRGPYRSIPIEQLLEEAEKLASEGCRELILIAQDLTWYGKDLYGDFALPELLRKLCSSEAVKGLEWIRLLYCYSEHVTDGLIEVMAANEKILKYIDLPLQHINDKLLAAMRRASTNRSIRNTIERLRAAMPEIVIRTTFITGLPGETGQEFEELYNFVKEMRFDRLGVFAYSPEEGTDAAVMSGQIDKETAETRRDALMLLQQQISLENNRRLIGTIQDVIIDELDEDGAYAGRLRADAPEIDNSVTIEALLTHDIIGKIVKVRITDAFEYDLAGELIV